MSAETKKTKLTLTVRKDIIELAKKRAKERGISVSKFFEDVVNAEKEKNDQKSAMKDFLDFIKKQDPVQPLPESDKDLYRKHIIEKYG